MRTLVLMALMATALLLPAAPALAQIGDSRLPLDIEADHVEVLDAEHRIVWRGNVNAVQGDSALRAARIDVHYTGTGVGGTNGWGDIDRIVATTDVFYITPEQTARGDRGVYSLAEETITLTGDVVIRQGDNTVTTTFFENDLVSGNSRFGEQGDGQRVRAVLVPAGDDETDGN